MGICRKDGMAGKPCLPALRRNRQDRQDRRETLGLGKGCQRRLPVMGRGLQPKLRECEQRVRATLACRPQDGDGGAVTGQNSVIQGDALEMLGGFRNDNTFDVIIADPPYNIGKDFGNASDCRSLEDYLDWSESWIRQALRVLSPAGLLYMYGFHEIVARIASRFPIERQRWLSWHYTNKAVPSSRFWQRSHEAILCLWKESRPRLNVDLIREDYTRNYRNCIGKPRRETYCRYNSKGKKTCYNGHSNGALPRDVIKVPALAGGAGRAERWFMCRTCGNKVLPPAELKHHRNCDVLKHPTQKPFSLTARLLDSVAVSGKKPLALVPFAGSGSECVVAKGKGIDFLGIEINPEYVEFANKWLQLTASDSKANG